MRLSIVASLLGFAIVTFTPAAHAETISTNIDTEIKTQSVDATFFDNDPFLLNLNTFMVSSDKKNLFPESILTEQEKLYREKMARWKEKQSHMWHSLPREKFVINASAYTAAADECGKSDGVTASGVKVEEKRTLACPPNLPFGVKVNINGMGTYVCEDRGGAIKGNHFDIYMETKAQAFAFGRQHLEAQLVLE